MLRKAPVPFAALAVALSLAACGNSTGNNGGGSNSTSAANLSYVKAQVDKLRASPEWSAPGPSINASALRGKTLFAIPIASQIPFVQGGLTGVTQAAAAAGMHFEQCPNQGQPSQWAQCMDQGISAKAAVIVLIGVDPKLIQPQLQQAKAAGIPVVECSLEDEGVPDPAGISASVPQPGSRVGRALADYSIDYFKGNVHALVVESLDVDMSSTLVNAMQTEFNTYCGSSCAVTTVNVPTTQWATGIQTAVQSALLKDPKINVVIPIYDGMAPNALAGINGASASSKVKMVTFNGTPAVEENIKNHDVVVMDIGQPVYWLGWNYVDQAMRVALGQPPATKEYNPIRIFDSTNLSELGDPISYDHGFNDSYVSGYKGLWGVQ